MSGSFVWRVFAAKFCALLSHPLKEGGARMETEDLQVGVGRMNMNFTSCFRCSVGLKGFGPPQQKQPRLLRDLPKNVLGLVVEECFDVLHQCIM